MSYENGIISKTDPINVEEPYFVMGVAPLVDEDGDDLYDIGYAGSNNHGMINPWSYIKPINSDVGYSDPPNPVEEETIFKNSLSVVTYVSGDSCPSNFKYIYDSPSIDVYKRLDDFRGYNHNERPEQIVDLTYVPNVLDFDKVDMYLRIDSNTTNNNVLDKMYKKQYPLATGPWYNAILIIANKGSERRVFIMRSRPSETDDIFIGFPYNNKEIVKLFKDINIQDYDCEIMAVIIPYDNFIDSNRGFHEIPTNHRAYTYMLAPECPPYKPYKKSVKITRPRDRSYWNITIKDTGANVGDIREFYIPIDSIITAGLTIVPKSGPVENLFEDSLTFQRWIQLTGDLFGGTIANGDFIREDYEPYMRGHIEISWYNFGTESNPNWVEPIITFNGPGGVITKVNTQFSKYTEVSWDNFIISGEIPNINMVVEYYFRDPRYRPEI